MHSSSSEEHRITCQAVFCASEMVIGIGLKLDVFISICRASSAIAFI